LFGNQLQIIDTSQAVVRQLKRFIKEEESINSGSVDLYSTLNGDSLLQLAQKLLSQQFQKPALAYTLSI
jgi:glutamate racemase